MLTVFRHIRDRIGYQHIGIGADFDDYPMTVLEDFRDVSMYEEFWSALADLGFNETEIRGVKGDNLLRAMREMENIARQIQQDSAPSEAKIPGKDLAEFPEWYACRSSYRSACYTCIT